MPGISLIRFLFEQLWDINTQGACARFTASSTIGAMTPVVTISVFSPVSTRAGFTAAPSIATITPSLSIATFGDLTC